MAIGLGYLFALRIPQNFDAPYRSAGIGDFWRRWHMSLSSWLRDYLYFPLGGNRKGATRTGINLMATMLLGGLWHGAQWTFVIWGGYHGMLLIADKLGAPLYRKLPRFLYQAQTFLLVVVGWVFFRSDSLKMAIAWLRTMFFPESFTASIDARTAAWFVVASCWAFFLPETWYVPFGTSRKWAPTYALAALATYFVMNGHETPFLYFQF